MLIFSYSENEFIRLGKKIGQLLKAQDVLVLTGGLGSGKTTFTRGLARGLSVMQIIKSPTYTIVREYEGKIPVYHLDVYRIGSDFDSIDLDHFLYGNGVTIIEWGELLGDCLPDDYLTIQIFENGQERCLIFNSKGIRSKCLIEEIKIVTEYL